MLKCLRYHVGYISYVLLSRVFVLLCYHLWRTKIHILNNATKITTYKWWCRW